MSDWVDKGVFTPEMAEYFGIDVGFVPKSGNVEELAEWGARLQRISHWSVAYTSPTTERGDDSLADTATKILLQFRDSPYAKPRNTLALFRWVRLGMESLGRSITDIGHKLEDAGDMILNAMVWSSFMNANPPRFVNKRVVNAGAGGEQAVIDMMNTPNAIIPWQDLTGQTKSPFETVDWESDRDGLSKAAALKTEYELTTTISAAAKGADPATSTGTLGEIRINEAKAAGNLADIVRDMALEQSRIITLMLEDAVHFLGVEGFYDLAYKAAGERAAEIKKYLTEEELDNIGDLFTITHPILTTGDPAVTSAILQRMFQLAPQEFNPREFISTIFELSGVPNASAVLAQARQILEPDDEHELLAQGVWIAPSPKEDVANHISQHTTLLEGMESGQPVEGVDGEDQVQNLLEQLPRHLQDTQRLAQIMAQLQQMQEQTAQASQENQALAQGQAGQGEQGGGFDQMEIGTAAGQSEDLAGAFKHLSRQSPAPGGRESK